MGSKIDGPSGPRPRFFLVGHGNFQRGIGHYTWLGCKSDISEEVRSHQSNVLSRLFVVPGQPTGKFRTTNSIAFIPHPINETCGWSKVDGPSSPRPRFFIVGLFRFQQGIGHYTWLACKTDISEEVRSHQSNVISRLFRVPRPPTD